MNDYQNYAKFIIPGTPFLITPSDTYTFPLIARGMSFAAAGDIAVVTTNGDTVVIPEDALAAGIIHPIMFKQVLSTGTTATGIVGYY